MTRMARIADITEVNPHLPKVIAGNPHQRVSFLPMSGISEEGYIAALDERALSDVAKGYNYFTTGDVLLAKITPCFENGKAAFVGSLPHDIGFGSTEFHVLRPSGEVEGRYLFHMIWNPAFRFVGEHNMTGTVGQKRVPTDFLKRYSIPLPPLAEQRRIAAILDKADAIRRKRRESSELLEEFLRSAFLEMFGDPVRNEKGWDVCEIGSVVSEILAGWSARGDDREPQVDEWAVLKISSVTSGRFLPSECKVVGSSTGRPVITPKRGDLLFSRANTRELVAATCLVQQDAPRRFLPDKLWKIIPAAPVRSEYLRYLLAHPGFRAGICRQASGTSGSMLNISQEKVRRVKMPRPPSEVQDRFAKFVWRVYGVRRQIETAADGFDQLFHSLAQRAFRGEL